MLMRPTPTPIACEECDGTGNATAWSHADCQFCQGFGTQSCISCAMDATAYNVDGEPMCAECLAIFEEEMAS